MVGDARTIEQLDTTRVLLSKRSTSPIDQQPFSSRLFHSLTPKLAPPFAGAWFLASDRSSCWEAPYHDRASWHINQTAYLCRCLWLLACGELLRTPYMRSSQLPTSTLRSDVFHLSNVAVRS